MSIAEIKLVREHTLYADARLHPHRQCGAALMVMLIILVIGISAALAGSLSATRLMSARQETTSAVLAQAKESLIGYAITYGDTHSGQVHGYLPCPDPNGSAGANSEGSSETCGSKNVSAIGRLPWKTLGLTALRDGDGECLWYAVSGTFKNNPMTDMMNWDTSGLFEILDASGATIAQNVVAVIFAPGATLDDQDRAPDNSAPTCGGNYTASNYLDDESGTDNAAVSGTANAVSRFRLGVSAQINDRMIFITKDDIFNAIMRRADFLDPARNPLRLMTQKAAECIADYGRHNNSPNDPGDKRLPWSGRSVPAIGTDCSYRDGSTSSTPPRIMYGRLPSRVSGSRSLTDNQIPQSYCNGTNSYYQLKSDGTNCPGVPDWSAYHPWWSNWKDHVFYTLAYSFRPEADSDPSCGTCLTVNGGGPFAAVVMFSGRKLSAQTRATDLDRLNFSNYLEGSNLISNTPINTSGNGNYQSGPETASFNDVLYCISPDLAVAPC